MTPRMRVKMSKNGLRDLMSGPEAIAMLERKAEAITNACNGDSSWGGYEHADRSSSTRARQHIWSADARNDEPRDQRLFRNLDAGAGA